jgi:hypothetical protein
VVASRSFARRLKEAIEVAPPADDRSPSAIRDLASRVATVLDDTTRRLGGSAASGAGGDAIEAVASAANALVAAIGTYGANDWKQDRGGTPAIDVLRSGVAEAGSLVRQATRLTEPGG